MRGTTRFVAISLLLLAPAVQAATIVYTTGVMSGAIEAVPNSSPATGTGTVTYDDVANTLTIQASWQNLTANVTVAHIHCCTATPFQLSPAVGVAVGNPSLPGFPTGAGSTTASYGPAVLDLSNTGIYGSAFLTNAGNNANVARDTLIAALNTGRAYLNIHTVEFTAGEIRGFLSPVPLPGVAWLLLPIVAAVARYTRHR